MKVKACITAAVLIGFCEAFPGGKRGGLEKHCLAELTTCNWTGADTDVKEAIHDCMVALDAESVSESCKPKLEKMQRKEGKGKRGKRGKDKGIKGKKDKGIEKLKEVCLDELESCGWSADQDKDAQKDVKNCMQDLSVTDVDDDCELELSKFQSKGGKEKLEQVCLDELKSCGWTDDQEAEGEERTTKAEKKADKEAKKNIKNCMKGLDVATVSEDCEPELVRLQRKGGKGGKRGKGRAKLEDACSSELTDCGWTGGKPDQAVKECLQAFDEDEASPECQPALQKMKEKAAKKATKGDKGV